MDWRERVAGETWLLVSFPDVAAAERRVAGLSAAGRWAAAARAAGGCQPIIVVDDAGAGWTAATLDDFDRMGATRLEQVAGAAIERLLAGRAPGPVLLAEGRYLLDGEFLGQFLARPRASVTPGGEPVTAVGLATTLPRLGDPAAMVVPVTDLAQPASAVRRLVRATRKSSDGLVSRWLNRPVSQRITAQLLLHVPNVRPSHMTLVVAIAAAAMVATLVFGGWPGLIAGGMLFQVTSVLDGVDGEIARATYRSSLAGATADTRVDIATNLGFFIGIAVSLTRLYGAQQAVVGGTVVLFGLAGMLLLGWLARRVGHPGSFDVLKLYYRRRFPTGWQHLVTETLVAMTSRDFFAFAFCLIIVFGGGWTVSWLLAGFSATWLVTIVAAIPGLLRGGPSPAPLAAEVLARAN